MATAIAPSIDQTENQNPWVSFKNYVVEPIVVKTSIIAQTIIHSASKIKGDADVIDRTLQLGCYITTAVGTFRDVSPLEKTITEFGNAQQIICFSQILGSISFFGGKIHQAVKREEVAEDQNKTAEEIRKDKITNAFEWAFQSFFTIANVGGLVLTLQDWKILDLGLYAATAIGPISTLVLEGVQSAVGIGFVFLGAHAVTRLYYAKTASERVEPILTLARCVMEVAIRILLLAGVSSAAPVVLALGITAKVTGMLPIFYGAFTEVSKKFEKVANGGNE